jgi:MPBQ/MSBQ methyltransferase
MQAAPSSVPVEPLTRVYAGEPVTLRMLRALGWGPELLNLGYFRWRGPFIVLNLTPSHLRLSATQHLLLRKAEALLGATRGDKILDVACGRGKSSFYLVSANPGTEVEGIDLLAENVQIAQSLFSHARGLSFRVADAMNLPYAPASFDKVFCLEAAFHFPDRARFLSECSRVLKPGGRLVVVDFMWEKDDRAAVLADPRTHIVQKTWGWTDFSSVGEYRRAAETHGFIVKDFLDWTGRVTRPLQWLSRYIANFAMTSLGRRTLAITNPLTRALSKGDWKEFRKAVLAHDFVGRYARYGVFVLEKKG